MHAQYCTKLRQMCVLACTSALECCTLLCMLSLQQEPASKLNVVTTAHGIAEYRNSHYITAEGQTLPSGAMERQPSVMLHSRDTG